MFCRELGRKERESLQKMAEIAKEGFLLKQQLIQEAKRGLEDKKVRITRKKWCLFTKQDPNLCNIHYHSVE